MPRSQFVLLSVLLAAATCSASVPGSQLRGAAAAEPQAAANVSLAEDVLAGAVEAGSACDHGRVGRIGKKAPGCLEACPQACGPLGQAIGAYSHGGKAAAQKVICANKRALACAYDHGSCRPLIFQAAGAGVPISKGGLYSVCSWLHTAVAVEPEAMVALAEEEKQLEQAPLNQTQTLDASLAEDALAGAVEAGSACDHGMVGRLGKKAPGCLEACPQACGPLGQAIGAYSHGGKAAVQKVVCANKWAFACAYDHGSCRPLISQAAGAGVPSSKGGLYSKCR